MKDYDSLKKILSRVYWIGGTPDAGKTSISRLLAERHRMTLYNYDGRRSDHCARLVSSASPEYRKYFVMTIYHRWVRRVPEAIAEGLVMDWTARFPHAIEDLEAMAEEGPVMAEGTGFFPELVLRVLADNRQAVWLLSAGEFKETILRERSRTAFLGERTGEPERVWRNLLATDVILARMIQDQCRASGLTSLEVDGSRTIEETAEIIERLFGLSASIPGTPAEDRKGF